MPILRKLAAIGVLVLVLGLVLTAGYFAYGWQFFQMPDQSEMRRYILSKLSDEQIRELHSQAQAEVARNIKIAKEEGEQYWDQKRKILARCDQDVAFRTRHPHDCSMPLNQEAIGRPIFGDSNVEIVFERNLLGVCYFARSVYEAKRAGCLPP